jgi:hypothetical protein
VRIEMPLFINGGSGYKKFIHAAKEEVGMKISSTQQRVELLYLIKEIV